MPAKSNYLQNKMIDFVYRGLAWTPPAGIYVALFTTAPTAAGGGTEVTGGSYARVNLPPSTTNWAATNSAGSTASPSTGTSGTTSNNVAVTFPTPTASWGTVVAVGIYDAASAGNLMELTTITPQVIGSGVVTSFVAGQLVVSEN